jgi:HK97 gp10 family phage protein
MSYEIVKGANEVMRKFDVIVLSNERIVVQALRWGAVTVRDDAKQHHTFKNRTHNLENSIQVRQGVGRMINGTLYTEVYAGMPYSGWVEFGTSKMAARPYLIPALYGNKDKIRDVLAAALRRAYGTGTLAGAGA